MSDKLNKGTILFVTAILITHFVLVLYCIKANAPTCDEIAHHIASGYSYLVTRDFRMNPANPPLVRELSALPLLFLNLKAPLSSQAWKEGNTSVFGREFFYGVNKNADEIIFWARVPIAFLSVELALLIFFWSKSLYGLRAGILSLSLYSLCPNIVAFAALATVDLGATLFICASLFTFKAFLKKPLLKNIILSGVCFGLAQASKYTSIFLIPIFILLAVIFYIIEKDKTSKPSLNKLISGTLNIFLIGAVILFASYLFEIKPLIKNAPDIPEKIEYIKTAVDKLHLGRLGLSKERAVWIAQNTPMPFSAYLIGLGGVIHQSSIGGYHTFLLGKFCDRGFWNYFILAFLTKTTLVTIFFFAFAAVLLFKTEKRKLFDSLSLLIPIVMLFAIISGNRAQVGIRYLLPVYPLIFVFIGSLSNINIGKTVKNMIFLAAISAQLIALMSAFPYPIAYFNELAGGPDNGYKVLRDSNLDWGQGLKALSGYIRNNRINSIKLYYFGTADPSYYSINFKPFEDSDFLTPATGIYAVSAQYLDKVKWAEKHVPIAKVAHSIFIYKF